MIQLHKCDTWSPEHSRLRYNHAFTDPETFRDAFGISRRIASRVVNVCMTNPIRMAMTFAVEVSVVDFRPTNDKTK